MPRHTRTNPNRKNEPLDRSRPNEATKMHASRPDESDRELRMGRGKDMNGGSRKSSQHIRHTPRGH